MADGTKPKKRRLVNVKVNELSLVDNPAVPDATFVIAKRDEEAGLERVESGDPIKAESWNKMADKVNELATTVGLVEPVDKAEGPEESAAAAEATAAVAEETDPATLAAELESEALGETAPKEPDLPDAETLAEELEAEVLVEKQENTVLAAFMGAIGQLRAVAKDLGPDGLRVLAEMMAYTAFKYGEEDEGAKGLVKFRDADEGTEEIGEHTDWVEKVMTVDVEEEATPAVPTPTLIERINAEMRKQQQRQADVSAQREKQLVAELQKLGDRFAQAKQEIAAGIGALKADLDLAKGKVPERADNAA